MRKLPQNASVRRAYTLGLALIFVLVSLQIVGVRFAADRQEISAVEINLSGRQRMLSQRIAWTMYRLASAEGLQTWEDEAQLRTLLSVCVDLMERSHLALLTRDKQLMDAALDAGASCLSPDFATLTAPAAPRAVITPPDGLLEFTNQAWDYATGDPQESDLQALIRFVDGPLVALLGQLDQATLEAQETSTAQLRQLLSINWILIAVLIFAEVLLIFRPMAAAVERSLSQLRQSNKKLQKSEARVVDFASTAAHQFWETDRDLKITWVGAPNAELQVYDPQANIGKHPWELRGIVLNKAEPGEKSLAEIMRARMPFRAFEYAMDLENGQRFWWHAHGRPVFGADGSFVGYRGTAREITEERSTREQLRASERMQALGKLTAGVSHDFNNILAVIQGYAELLSTQASVAVRREAVREIVAASQRGASLTSQLLSFGRIKQQHTETIDLQVFLDKLEALLNRTLGEGFEVQTTLPSSGLTVLCDLHLLEDACLNLATNARDACTAGGRLWIDAKWVGHPEGLDLAETAPPDLGYVCLSFKDNGSGMSPSTANRVFEPFFTTKPVGVGTGLGLSMVYGFAKQSNGTITVDSTLDAGTTFSLYLPRAEGQCGSTIEAGARDAVLDTGQSALLVEDNDALRRLTRRHLERLGFVVTEAIDGGSALERLGDKGPFDLLVLDILLPGRIDGVQIAQKARQEDPNVSVLFCSGFIEQGLEHEGIDVSQESVLQKPYTMDAFQVAVSEALSKRST